MDWVFESSAQANLTTERLLLAKETVYRKILIILWSFIFGSEEGNKGGVMASMNGVRVSTLMSYAPSLAS